MNTKKKGMFLAILAAFLWGITGIFSRQLGEAGFSSSDIAFVRCFFTGLVYFLFVRKTNPKALKTDRRGMLICIIYGMVAYSISFLTFSIAIERTPIAVANVLMFMSPVWASILGVIVFREKLSSITIFTIGVCLVGGVLTSNLIQSSGGTMDALGIMAGVINGIGVALQIVIPRYFSKKYEQDTMLVYGFLGGALLLGILADIPLIFKSLFNVKVLIAMLLISLLCTMVANISYVKSSGYIGTTLTSILTSLQTVVGGITGYLCFQETMTGLQMLGAVIIVVGALGPEICQTFLKKSKTV